MLLLLCWLLLVTPLEKLHKEEDRLCEGRSRDTRVPRMRSGRREFLSRSEAFRRRRCQSTQDCPRRSALRNMPDFVWGPVVSASELLTVRLGELSTRGVVHTSRRTSLFRAYAPSPACHRWHFTLYISHFKVQSVKCKVCRVHGGDFLATSLESLRVSHVGDVERSGRIMVAHLVLSQPAFALCQDLPQLNRDTHVKDFRLPKRFG